MYLEWVVRIHDSILKSKRCDLQINRIVKTVEMIDHDWIMILSILKTQMEGAVFPSTAS